MTKKPLVAIILLCLYQGVYAQRNTEDFEITLPEKKVTHSLYNEISYIDSRHDTTTMGIVQLGAFNRKAHVIPKTHLSRQLADVLGALKDSAAEDGKLLFHLRKLIFAELTGAMSERGYCYLRADLYAKDSGHYRKAASLDTIIFVKSLDVTRGLFRRASRTLAGFIAVSLEKKPDTTAIAYTMDEVQNMDKIEKLSIPLYTNATLNDGIYLSFTSFSNQLPDHQAVIEMKSNNISSVRVKNEDGKPGRFKTRNIYAVVYEGKPYVSTDYGYYPLTKKDADFYFIGKAKVTANTGDVITASIFFGLIGGLMASNAATSFEMKLDHLTGGFIRLREKAEVNLER